VNPVGSFGGCAEEVNVNMELSRMGLGHPPGGELAGGANSARIRTTRPLVWPPGFPPGDWWGRFFTGVPPLGPSVSFFRCLEREQAARSTRALADWSDAMERRVALKFGECLRTVGWKTPYFIPNDQVVAVVGGPSFGAFAQQDLAYLLDEFNRRLGRNLKAEFLPAVIAWDDPSVRLGELVAKVTAQLRSATSEPQWARLRIATY